MAIMIPKIIEQFCILPVKQGEDRSLPSIEEIVKELEPKSTGGKP